MTGPEQSAVQGQFRRMDEQGIALAIAIFALAVIGALVAANFFVGRLEQQSGQYSLFARQAAEGAETGLVEAVALVPASSLVALPLGGAPLDLGIITLSPGVRVERQVSRLTGTLFFIRVRGTRQDAAGSPLAARALGALVRLVSDARGGPPRVAPLTRRGWVQLY
jgi:hypothetical protein